MDPVQTGGGEQERPSRRHALIVTGSVLLVLAIGGGAYAVASAVSSSSTPTSTTAPSAPAAAGNVVSGLVTAVSSSSLTVETASRTSTTFSITSSTTVVDRTGANVGRTALRTGIGVTVTPESGNHSVAARVVVRAGGRRFGGFGGLAGATVGRVTSVGSSSFVMTPFAFRATTSGPTGPVTVTITSSTTFQGLGGQAFTKADLKVGDDVAVTGGRSGSTVTATAVTEIPFGGNRPGGAAGGGFGGPFGNSGPAGNTGLGVN